MADMIVRDHLVNDPLDRIKMLEGRLARLERVLATVAGADVDAAITAHEAEADPHSGYLTPAEHTAIGTGSPHHAAVTLAADADVLLGLSTQQLTLDTQSANRVLAGPTSGAAADPTFRALVDADIPAAIMRDTEMGSGIAVYDQSGALDLTTSYQDVPGLTTGAFIPSANEWFVAALLMYWRQDQGTNPCNAGDVLRSQVLVNATAESRFSSGVATGGTGGIMTLQFYRISLSASTEYTIKAQATNVTGARGRAGTLSQFLTWRMLR